MMLTYRSNDVASLLANDVVSCGHKHKKKDTIFIVSFFLAPTVGLEPTTHTFAVPKKAVGLSLFLGFFDRGTNCALAVSAVRRRRGKMK